jgi:glutaminase
MRVSEAGDRPQDEAASVYVSTGHLPPQDEVGRLLTEAWTEARSDDGGEVSRVYPALAAARPDLFGAAIVGVDGRTHHVGDATVAFTIMSVAKPFVYALVCETMGPDEVRDLIGADATGLPFNDPEAVRRSADGRTNPMVNPGAIATTSLAPGETGELKWGALLTCLSRFAGHELQVDEATYASASATNHRNRELARLLEERGRLYAPLDVAVDLYTRQSCVSVTAHDLAVMGATLADGGVNPVTNERVVQPHICHHVLAAMLTAGLYESSGTWLHAVGLPAKSGIGGGIVTVSPGKGGLGTYAPPLDAEGNSVRGRRLAAALSRRLGLDLLASAPPG